MNNIFITKIDVAVSEMPYLEVPNYDEPECREYQAGWAPTKEAFTTEIIHADYIVVKGDRQWRYGFSKNALEAIGPILELSRDRAVEIQNLYKKILEERSSNREKLDHRDRLVKECLSATSSLRSSWWLRFKFLFNSNMSL